MNIEIDHILIDLTLKSLVILGVPSLVAAFLPRRHFSANERFTVLSASIATLVVLAITGITIWKIDANHPLATPSFPTFELSQWAKASIPMVWLAVTIPLMFLTCVKIAIGEWQCIKKTSRRVDTDSLPAGVSLNCPVIMDPSCTFPCVKGVLFQRVFVPEEFFDWPESNQRNILLHEHFHVVRRDILWKCIADVAVSIFWFNPLVFYVRNRLGLEQEIACDNGVLTIGVDGAQYSETILWVAKRQTQDHSLGTSIRMSGRDSHGDSEPISTRFPFLQRLRTWSEMLQLRCRILSIMDPKVCRRSLGVYAHTVLFIGIFVLAGPAFHATLLRGETIEINTVLLRHPITSSSDDAEEYVEAKTVSLDSRDLEICVDHGLEKNQTIGLRFSELMIPKDAKILSAKIVFTPDATTPTTPAPQNVCLQIFVQEDPESPTFRRTKKNISDRLKVDQKSVDWEIDQPWTSGVRSKGSTTPELKELVEARMRCDWEPGDAIVVILKAKSYESTRSAAAFDSSKSTPLTPPTLRLLYSVSR